MRRVRHLLLIGTALLATAGPALSQTGDALIRINQLEAQVRDLNGRIEELNFFILQMQEELRRQKEDTEFRFQDLEGQQRGDVAGIDGQDTASIAPVGEERTLSEIEDGPVAGAPPRDLGTLTFEPGALDLAPEYASDSALVAAIEAAGDDAALLRVAEDFATAGEHGRAAQVLEVHARRYPDAATAPAGALAWGRSLLALERPEEAAEVLLDGHERFGDAPEAADLLLGVGTAMARLGNRDIACATFDEVDRLYPVHDGSTAGALRTARVETTC